VSDFLVQLQEKIASYPAWLVACATGVVVALILILLAKAFRAFAVIVFIIALGVGGWLAFRAFFSEKREESRAERLSVIDSAFQPAMATIAVIVQPLSCQRFQVRCNSRQ
jgi:uncharacterized membrane protein YhhN